MTGEPVTLARWVTLGLWPVKALWVVWPDPDAIGRYAPALTRTIEAAGWVPLFADLATMGHPSPGAALLHALGGSPAEAGPNFASALAAALDARTQPGARAVLVLARAEVWARPKWSAEVAAFRAVLQSRIECLAVVFQSADSAAVGFLSQRRDQPLYAWGMRLPVDDAGMVLRAESGRAASDGSGEPQ